MEKLANIRTAQGVQSLPAVHTMRTSLAQMGKGQAFGHHGEILQGAMRDNDHKIQRFLFTLPCSQLVASARFEPSRDNSKQIVAPQGKTKSRRAVEVTLQYLNRSQFGGHLTLDSNIAEGFGLGSSTTDVVASIRAVANAFHIALPPETVASLAVEAEHASDAIMFDDTCVLFAQRQGVVLEHLGTTMPSLHVLSVNTAPNQPMGTLEMPAARYCDWELQHYRALCGMIRRAIRSGDPYLLGRVATASAYISQRYLPKPAFAEILAICKAHGGCGVQVSHSGTVLGLLFNGECSALSSRINGAITDLQSIGMAPDFQFSTFSRRLKHAS